MTGPPTDDPDGRHTLPPEGDGQRTLNESPADPAPTGRPPFDPQRTSDLSAVPVPAATPLDRLADHELLEEVGRGGMGVVFKARHIHLGRIVALKMILGGRLARPEDLQRFQTEAAAAAQLQHPGIVAVYEAGTENGQAFLSMEFVRGSSLAQQLTDGPLPGRRAAAYLELTARAVHYAHQHGVLHRDLKPANVLLDEHDHPKVTDFGLAKLFLTDSGQTRTGAVIGTPSYMSPEQAAARRDLGPPCDVYSLGAILYELLTDRPPFRGETALATLSMVADQEPVPPRLLNPKVDTDLETICLKCLEKDPARRYPSAEALADDLRRYLDHEPIAARRLGRLGRAWKWCRRKPAAAALLAVSALAAAALVCGLAAFSYLQGRMAEDERALRKDAETQREAAVQANRLAETRLESMRHLLYLAQVRQARQAWDDADLDRAEKLLTRWEPTPARLPDLRGWEWHLLHELCGGRFALAGHAGRTNAVAFRPDGLRLASAGGEPAVPGTARVWDAATGKLLHTLRGHRTSVTGVAWSPDGHYLATSGYDGTVRVWDAETGAEVIVLTRGGTALNAVAFSADGRRLAAAASDGMIYVWDVRNLPGKAIPAPAALRGHAGAVTCVAFAGDGKLASGGADRTVRVWDAAGKSMHTLRGHAGEVHGVAFDRSGTLVASGGGRGLRSGEVRVWDVVAGVPRSERTGLPDRILDVAFADDGRLAAATEDGTVRVWGDPIRGEAAVFRGDGQVVYCVAFAADGRLASGGRSGRIRLWNRSAGLESYALPGPALTGWVAFSPDGKRVVSAGRARGQPGEIQVWDVERGTLLRTLSGPLGSVHAALSPDGNRVAAAGEDGTVWLFDLRPGRRPIRFKGHTGEVVALAFSPDGRLLATAGRDETIRIWDVETGELVAVLRGHGNKVWAVAFSPDGKWLASGSIDQTVRLWEVATGASSVLRGHTGAALAVAFSPDGRYLASGGSDRVVILWDLKTRAEARRLEGSAGQVTALAFHPRQQRLATAGQDRVARLWDLVTGQEILELGGASGPLTSVAFSKDGRRLACGGHDTPLRVWEGR